MTIIQDILVGPTAYTCMNFVEHIPVHVIEIQNN